MASQRWKENASSEGRHGDLTIFPLEGNTGAKRKKMEKEKNPLFLNIRATQKGVITKKGRRATSVKKASLHRFRQQIDIRVQASDEKKKREGFTNGV